MSSVSGRVERGPGWELRLGAWQDVLADVECDLLCVDAPYSDTTHRGHDASVSRAARDANTDKSERRPIDYASLTAEQAAEWGARMSEMARGWICALTDHHLAPAWTAGMEVAGRYAFAPLPAIEHGGRFRPGGDGPAGVTAQLVVARPRSTADGRFPYWGSLPGYYVCRRERKAVIGGKPLAMMRAIVCDYSRAGDVVCDPCAGAATTLVAAVETGRTAIGAEMDPATFILAARRLRAARYRPMLPGLEPCAMTQMAISEEAS